MNRSVSVVPLLFVSLFCVIGWASDDWPQWRGPTLNGVCLESNLPTAWSPSENILWRTELPGPAGASPVVGGGRIFLTSPADDDLLLMCFDLDGKELWRKKMSSGNQTARGDEGNSASPSPATDGKHVWAMMGDGQLACFEVDGTPVWEMDLQEEYGKFQIQFGMTSTPILDNGRLYIQLIHGSMRSSETSTGTVVALDAKNGKQIWKQIRKTDGTAENKHSYTSPIIYRDDEREYLLIHGADYITAHALDDGKEIWRCGGLNSASRYNRYLRFVASPSCIPGLIIVPSAKNGPVLALNPGNLKGDVTDDSEAFHWKMRRFTPDVPSPVIHDGLVYLCRENGVLICVDAKTGEKLYEKRTVDDRHRGSPIVADGKVYLTARRGITTVVKAGRKFEILAKNDLGEPTSASPAISEGRIYIRTFDALYAIGEK